MHVASTKARPFLVAIGFLLVATVILLSAGSHESFVARAQSMTEQDALRRLAERLLGSRLLGPGAQPLTTELLSDALPVDLPFDIMLPPGHHIVGSLLRRSGADAVGATIVLDLPASPAEVLAFYERELGARGWTLSGTPPSGLQPTLQPVTRSFCRGDRGPSLDVTIFPRITGPNDVRLTYEGLFPFQCQGRVPFGMGADVLPPLYAPTGIELLPSNPLQPVTGGKPALQASDGIAETTESVAELEAHFAQQLAAAGWTRLSGGSSGPVAWSSWRIPTEGDWRGIVLVLEGPAETQRTIHVQVATAAAPPR